MNHKQTQNKHPLYDANKTYFKTLINDFSFELSKGSLNQITKNPTLIGIYAESLINSMIKRVLVNANISTGSVLTITNLRMNEIFNGKLEETSKLKELTLNDISIDLLTEYKKEVWKKIHTNNNIRLYKDLYFLINTIAKTLILN